MQATQSALFSQCQKKDTATDAYHTGERHDDHHVQADTPAIAGEIIRLEQKDPGADRAEETGYKHERDKLDVLPGDVAEDGSYKRPEKTGQCNQA